MVRYNLTEPIPLEVKHVAVEIIMEPFCPLVLVFELGRYPPDDAVLTPAISPITGRLVEGRNI